MQVAWRNENHPPMACNHVIERSRKGRDSDAVGLPPLLNRISNSDIPPTAKPGVLDDVSKPDKGSDKIKIRRYGPFFVPKSKMIQIVMVFLFPIQK